MRRRGGGEGGCSAEEDVPSIRLAGAGTTKQLPTAAGTFPDTYLNENHERSVRKQKTIRGALPVMWCACTYLLMARAPVNEAVPTLPLKTLDRKPDLETHLCNIA